MHVTFHTYPRGWPGPLAWNRLRRNWHQFSSGRALRHGMEKHGVTTSHGRRNKTSDADMAVMWSWKQKRLIEHMQATGRHLLVIERGFIQPRNEWFSLTLDGFNGRGKFAPAGDKGERFERHFSHHLKPWIDGGEYALVIGQVPRDSALHGADIVAWARQKTEELLRAGQRVVYRPHPLTFTPCPEGAELSTGSLKEDFAKASCVVTFNSTTAVEAVLAGIPTVISDIGSVAYPMASHEIGEPLRRPDRTAWCHDLAWRQWKLEELEDGTAWEHVRRALPPPAI
jgi:hypothetical protein